MPHRHATRVIDLPDGKQCTIAVISDTHGKPHPNLFPALERNRPSLILHAGDVGDLDLITELEGISQTVYVRGNTDPTGPMWPESVSLRIRLEASRRLDLLLLHFAVASLRLNKVAQTLLKETLLRSWSMATPTSPFSGNNKTRFSSTPDRPDHPEWVFP